MDRQAVEFVSGSSLVRGRLFTPDGPHDSRPALVMVPGFSASSRFPVFEQYAAAFAGVGSTVAKVVPRSSMVQGLQSFAEPSDTRCTCTPSGERVVSR